MATIRIKLKTISSHNKARNRYTECSNEQRRAVNDKISQLLPDCHEYTKHVNIANRIIREALPKLKPNQKEEIISTQTKEILDKREKAIREGNVQEFKTLTKDYRRSRTNDKTKYVMKTISNDLDLQEKWIGIRQLKKGYAPMPFHRNNSKGNHVKCHERAEATAEYLATKQWGQSETDTEHVDHISTQHHNTTNNI